jgi:L-iditol 2-dehydrogenase
MKNASPPADGLQTAAYLTEPGRVELRQIPIPRPAAGQVVLHIERALAGGTDRKAFMRGHPQIPMPGVFGHRYAGTVAALGENAPAFEIGQPVMGVHSAPCLDCALCRKERWNLCPHVMREKVLGAFAQYLCVPAAVARQNLFSRPASLSAQHAALLEPLACVVHGLQMIDWRGVDRVLVLGLGAMGLLFAQLLPCYTRAEKAGAGRRAATLDLARRFGLNPVWHSDVSRLRDVPDARNFDCVLECTGNLQAWEIAMDLAAPGGQVLFFGGLPRGTTLAVDSYRLHYEDLRLVGSFHFSPRDVARAREFLLSGQLELDSLISGRFPLSELAHVMYRLREGEGIQYAIDPW